MQAPTPPTKPIPPTPPSMKSTSSGITSTEANTPVSVPPSVGQSKSQTTEASIAPPTTVPPLTNSNTYKDTNTETAAPPQTQVLNNKPVMNFGLLFSLVLIGAALFVAVHWWKKSKTKHSHHIDCSSESSDELVKLILSQENHQPKTSQTIAKKESTKKSTSNFDFRV